MGMTQLRGTSSSPLLLQEFRHGRMRALRQADCSRARDGSAQQPRDMALAALSLAQLHAMRIRLMRAARAEASRGKIHHRCYDLARHVRLTQQLRQVMAEISLRGTFHAASPPAHGAANQQHKKGVAAATPCHSSSDREAINATVYGAADQGPFSSQVASVPAHSLAPPSDNRSAAPTSRDIVPETDYSACADGASAI